MIKSLVGALKTLVRNPMLFLPAIAAAIAIVVLSIAFEPVLSELAFQAVVLENIPDGAAYSLPFQFAALYPGGTVALIVLGILVGIVFISTSYWYAVYVKMAQEGRAGIRAACNETMAALKKIMQLMLFVVLMAFFFGALAVGLMLAAAAVPVLGIALIALPTIALLYLYIMLAFSVQALAIGSGTVKEALQQSWAFSSKGFLGVVLFIVVLAIIGQGLAFIGNSIAEASLNEDVGLWAVAAFWVISAAYTGIAMPLYYLGKKTS